MHISRTILILESVLLVASVWFPSVFMIVIERLLLLRDIVINTVEPPNNGHVMTRHFVHYREVVLSSEVKNVLV